jgi:hypothetical protein
MVGKLRVSHPFSRRYPVFPATVLKSADVPLFQSTLISFDLWISWEKTNAENLFDEYAVL